LECHPFFEKKELMKKERLFTDRNAVELKGLSSENSVKMGESELTKQHEVINYMTEII